MGNRGRRRRSRRRYVTRQRRTNRRRTHSRSFFHPGRSGFRDRRFNRERGLGWWRIDGFGRSKRRRGGYAKRSGGGRFIVCLSFRVRLISRLTGSAVTVVQRFAAIAVVVPPHQLRDMVVNRAGVRFLLGYAEVRQEFEDLVRRYL